MRKPSLLIIFLTVFMDLVGFGIVLPLLPTYGEEYNAGGFMIGAIIASFSVMQFLFAPVWGKLSDRIGRRPVLLISNLGSAASYAMFALSAWSGFSSTAAVLVLLGSRVFAGACGANLSVASAYIADITPPEGRSKGMGMIGAAFGLGFILGPPLGSRERAAFRPGGARVGGGGTVRGELRAGLRAFEGESSAGFGPRRGPAASGAMGPCAAAAQGGGADRVVCALDVLLCLL